MTEFLSSLKADLLDRRMLPLLALLGVGLAAAIAYVVLGGGGGSSSGGGSRSTPSASVAPASPGSSGPSLPVTQAPANPNAAVAETTEGARYQHHSGAHNPFTPLAKAKTASSSGGSGSSGGSSSTAQSATPSSTGSTGSSSGSGSSGAGAGGATPEKPAEPTPTKPQPHKPKTVYTVDVLYGVAPTVSGQVSQLTPFTGLKRMQPLPSAQDPRVVYAGVSSNGQDALFTLAGEAILKGQGTCVPRPTQCEAIALAQEQSEEFGYLEESGQTVVYELKVVSIAKHQASAARAARVNRLDRAGQVLMRRLSPYFLRHLRFSSARGVLVYATHRHR